MSTSMTTPSTVHGESRAALRGAADGHGREGSTRRSRPAGKTFRAEGVNSAKLSASIYAATETFLNRAAVADC
jgi:hypothetical protein